MANGIAALILTMALHWVQKKIRNAALTLPLKAGLFCLAQVGMKEEKWQWLL